MRFSVIIINYKTLELTRGCLRSLFQLPNQEDLEIIVIDNNSEDGSAEKLRAEFGNRVKLIANKKNLGFAGANNQGVAVSHGQYLIFLNSDTIVKKDFLIVGYYILKSNQNIGIVSPRLKLENGDNQKAAFGKFPTLIKLLNQSTKKEINIDESQEYFFTDWVSGCALMIGRELFQKIDGWDDRFFLYYEDIDICRRAYLAGYKSAVMPKISITHLGGQSLQAAPKKNIIYYQSQDYYFKKHYGLATAWAVKLTRGLYSLIKPN